MADTTTFFAQISSFFSAFFAYIFGALSSKHRSTTLCDDLEVGIPSVEQLCHFNTASSAISGSRSIDGFVDVGLDPENKIQEMKTVSVATHTVPDVDTDHGRHIAPTVIPMIPQTNAVDNRSKHRAFQFGPYTLYEDHHKSRSRRRQDSYSDLLDLFPAPPTYIPPLPPVIIGDDVSQTVEKTLLIPTEDCPSPTISEESTLCSSSESDSISSLDPSISISISLSISDETANTSIHEILELPCTSAIFKALSSRIDVKDKKISRLTLIQNPEILVLPTTDFGIPHSPLAPHSRPQSFCAFTDPQPLEDASPIHNLDDSSHRPLDKHTSVQASVQVVPAAPTKWVRPYVAPLRIVKKNKVQRPKVQRPVVPFEPTVARRPLSGNWEQALDDVLQAFRDAESEDGEFRALFGGNASFVTQSSEVGVFGDERGDLNSQDEYHGDDDDDDDCQRRFEESFYSIDENLSMLMAPPPSPEDLVTLKVEVPASVSLSSEGAAVSQRVMKAKDEEVDKMDANVDMNVPELRLCDCEECEDFSCSWTAVTDDGDGDNDDDDGDDDHRQGDDQWSERLELNAYVS